MNETVIDLKWTNLEQVPNLTTEKTLYKYCRGKNSFMILNLLCWSFQRIQKALLIRVFASTTGASGTNVENIESDI